MSRSAMGRRASTQGGREHDVACVSCRHAYCYLQRAGASAGIKRGIRRRERRDARTEIRREVS